MPGDGDRRRVLGDGPVGDEVEADPDVTGSVSVVQETDVADAQRDPSHEYMCPLGSGWCPASR